MARGSFKELVTLAEIADVAEILPMLIELQWSSPQLLRDHQSERHKLPLSDSQREGLTAAVRMWFHRPVDTEQAARRRDLPVLKAVDKGAWMPPSKLLP